MRKYPIGIQNFRKIQEEDYIYVDKTEIIYQLLTEGVYYFFSRPRRFGKSLLLSTIKEIFLGSQELFKGLWIEKKWDWTKKNPVIHLSFNNIGARHLGLRDAISLLLKENAALLGIHTLYNPFSILSFFKQQQFSNFWFETGTPTFLIEQIKRRNDFNFETLKTSQAGLSDFNIENINPTTLLFQTGYLTIKKYDPKRLLYTLSYPNNEVKQSLLTIFKLQKEDATHL